MEELIDGPCRLLVRLVLGLLRVLWFVAWELLVEPRNLS